MAVEVFHRHGQLLSSPHPSWPSVLGDGMLERARSTSLALLGASAAIGLGLTAFALNQGWPLLPGAPIPSLPVERGAVREAVTGVRAPAPAAHGAAAGGVAAPAGRPRGHTQGTRHGAAATAPTAPAGGRVGSGRKAGVPAVVPVGGGGGGGPATTVPAALPQAAPPTPASSAPPTPAASAPSPAEGEGSRHGHAYAYGREGAPPALPEAAGGANGHGGVPDRSD